MDNDKNPGSAESAPPFPGIRDADGWHSKYTSEEEGDQWEEFQGGSCQKTRVRSYTQRHVTRMYGAHHPERWPGEDVRGFCIRLVLGARFSGPSCPPPYPTCDAGSIPPIKTLGDSSAAQWCILESENRFFDHATGSGGGAGVTKNDIQMPALILSHGETIFQIYRWASCHLPLIRLLIREGLAAMPGSIKKQGMAGSLRQSIDSGMSRMCPGKTLLLQNIQRLFRD